MKRAHIVSGVLLLTMARLGSADEAVCPRFDVAAKALTPVDLYQAVIACAKNSPYDTAVEFFALAGVFGRFDTYRVADVSAHSAPGALKTLALDAIPSPHRDELQKVAMSTYADHDKHAALCQKISELGPPTYEPTYMRAHGLDSLLGKGPSARGAGEPFDAKVAWRKALSSYLDCQSG